MNVIIRGMRLEGWHYAVLFEDSRPLKRLAESSLYNGWYGGFNEMYKLAHARGMTVVGMSTMTVRPEDEA